MSDLGAMVPRLSDSLQDPPRLISVGLVTQSSVFTTPQLLNRKGFVLSWIVHTRRPYGVKDYAPEM